MLQSYVQILQLQTSPDQFLKAKTVLLLLIKSGVLFQSMLPLKDFEFIPKDVVNALGSARILYSTLFYRSILLSISQFACSPSILFFHLHSLFEYEGPISVLKKGAFFGKIRA